jgi:hypothetical protein
MLAAVSAALLGALLLPLLGGAAMLRAVLLRLPDRAAWSVLLCAAAGLAIGLGAFVAGPAGPRVGLGPVFIVGGWWDLSMPRFVAERAPLALGSLGPMLATPLRDLPVMAASLGVLALMAMAAGGWLARGQRPGWLMLGLAALAAGLTMAVGGALAAYAVVWTLGQLNFWNFALLTIGWQLWRHGHL